MSKRVCAALVILPLLGLAALGCGSSTEWQPAVIPPETMVPPPPIPSEAKPDDAVDAFDIGEPATPPPAATGTPAEPPAEPGSEGPAPAEPAPAKTPPATPKAP
jgi:hypothetical protein